MLSLERPDSLFTVSKTFLWRLVLILTIVLLCIFARNILLTIFLGILLSVVLDATTDWVRRTLHFSRSWAYGSVLKAGATALAAIAYFLGPRALTQMHELSSTVPGSRYNTRNGTPPISLGKRSDQSIGHVHPASEVGE